MGRSGSQDRYTIQSYPLIWTNFRYGFSMPQFNPCRSRWKLIFSIGTIFPIKPLCWLPSIQPFMAVTEIPEPIIKEIDHLIHKEDLKSGFINFFCIWRSTGCKPSWILSLMGLTDVACYHKFSVSFWWWTACTFIHIRRSSPCCWMKGRIWTVDKQGINILDIANNRAYPLRFRRKLWKYLWIAEGLY